MEPTPYAARLGDRRLFPELQARSYLNHAAIAPLSLAAVEQAQRLLHSYARGGLDGFKEWLPQRQRLKGTLAGLLGAEPDDLGFVQSTTAGIVQIAYMLPWHAGDRVVLFEGEFPANVTPWQQAAEVFDLDLVWLSLDAFHRSVEEGLAALREQLAKGARLVAVSAVQFQTGLRMPIEAMGALCHDYGCELFVDAIQALGAVPLDVRCVDYLSCGGHKWLMGPEGTGFVYVRPERRSSLVPRLGGWLGHEDPLDFLFLGEGHLRYDRPLRREASVVEQGAQSAVGLAALEGAVDLIAQLGVEAIFEHVGAFHDALEAGLVERGFVSARVDHGQSASLCVRPPPGYSALDLAAGLGAVGVSVSTPDGWLRFAPHWPNALAEVPEILRALDDALRSA